jgi:uncharacterized protein
MTKDSQSSWRVRDVFYVLFLYCVLLSVFFLIERGLIGEVIDDESLKGSLLLLEDVFDAIFIAGLSVFFVLKGYGASFAEMGITLKDWKINILKGLAVGIGLWVFISLFHLAITKVIGVVPSHQYMEKLRMSQTFGSYLAILISVIILSPLSEEIYLRGFAYTVFRKRYGKNVAIILSHACPR